MFFESDGLSFRARQYQLHVCEAECYFVQIASMERQVTHTHSLLRFFWEDMTRIDSIDLEKVTHSLLAQTVEVDSKFCRSKKLSAVHMGMKYGLSQQCWMKQCINKVEGKNSITSNTWARERFILSISVLYRKPTETSVWFLQLCGFGTRYSSRWSWKIFISTSIQYGFRITNIFSSWQDVAKKYLFTTTSPWVLMVACG